MKLTVKDKQTPVVHKNWFQLSVASHCRNVIQKCKYELLYPDNNSVCKGFPFWYWIYIYICDHSMKNEMLGVRRSFSGYDKNMIACTVYVCLSFAGKFIGLKKLWHLTMSFHISFFLTAKEIKTNSKALYVNNLSKYAGGTPRTESAGRNRKVGHQDDVIKWNHFPRYWPFVRGIHRSPVNSPHKGQWRGAFIIFDLRLNKRFSKQWWGWWFETPSRSLWRHCNVPP